MDRLRFALRPVAAAGCMLQEVSVRTGKFGKVFPLEKKSLSLFSEVCKAANAGAGAQ